MVSRADLSGWPIVGQAARRVGTVFVDRDDASSGATAIREMRQLLKAGQTVNLFPEGTTFDGDVVRPFHPGAFVAALRTGATIVPVGPPTRVAMCIGEPLQIGPKARAQALRDAAHAAVQELVHDARARCDGSP